MASPQTENGYVKSARPHCSLLPYSFETNPERKGIGGKYSSR